MNFPSQNNRTRTKLTWATMKPFTDEWMFNLLWGIFPFIYMYLSVSLSWTCVNKSDVSASRNGANHENLYSIRGVKSNIQLSTVSLNKIIKSFKKKHLKTGFVDWWNLPQMKLVVYFLFFSENCWKNMPCGGSCYLPSDEAHTVCLWIFLSKFFLLLQMSCHIPYPRDSLGNRHKGNRRNRNKHKSPNFPYPP